MKREPLIRYSASEVPAATRIPSIGIKSSTRSGDRTDSGSRDARRPHLRVGDQGKLPGSLLDLGSDLLVAAADDDALAIDPAHGGAVEHLAHPPWAQPLVGQVQRAVDHVAGIVEERAQVVVGQVVVADVQDVEGAAPADLLPDGQVVGRLGQWPQSRQFDLLETAQRLRATIKPFVMRRVKSDVAQDLPDKIEQEMIVPLAEEFSCPLNLVDQTPARSGKGEPLSSSVPRSNAWPIR